MSVIVHNPSSLDMSEIKIAVPHGKFSIQGFDSKLEQFIDVASSVTCHRDFDDERTVF